MAVKNFKLKEFACKCGCDYHIKGAEKLVPLMEFLEVIRSFLGDREITIMSGARCPDHNRKCGGAKASQHMAYKAADIIVKGLSAAQVQAALFPARKELGIKGLGFYESFTHVDIRDSRYATFGTGPRPKENP